MIAVWAGVTALVLLAVAGYVAAFLLCRGPGDPAVCERCGAEYPRWRNREYCPACRADLDAEWRATNHCARCLATRSARDD